MNKRFRTILQYIFFLGLGIFLVWWSIKDLSSADKSQIKAALKTARYFLIIPVAAILVLSHFIRALRWRLLIGSLGYTTSKANPFFAVMIGYLANQAVPRLGEVLKCTVLARYEKIPVDKLIGTVILERVIDALTLLLIFGITLAIQPNFYPQLIDAFLHSSETDEHKKTPVFMIGLIVIGVVAVTIILWMLIKKKNFNDALLAFSKKVWRNIWQGISAIQHLKKKSPFFFF